MFTLNIHTGNDSFKDGQNGGFEVADILRKVANKLQWETGTLPTKVWECNIIDSNGNSVGSAKLTHTES
jgi:hypothetical protein